MATEETSPTRIVLASQSPTRAALLTAAGVDFEMVPALIDERSVEAPLIDGGAGPADIALALAAAKARAVSATHPEAFVIGADQTLDMDNRRWTKPEGRAEAARQLGVLAGREHRLHTGVVGARGESVIDRYVATAVLRLRPLTAREIDAYLDAVGDVALSSVGGYQIEGRGIQLFERIDGDYFTILGLPLLVVLGWLRREGALP